MKHKILGKFLLMAVFGLLFWYSPGLKAQFFSTAPTLDGSASEGDYVTDGAWSMGWDDTYLYLRYSGGGSTEPAIFYIDVDPMVPVSGGSNSNGSLVGETNWSITPTLPMRADFMIYWEANYAEYRTDNGSGGWSGNTTITTSDRSNTGTASREIRLDWTWMGLSGRPSAFNWYGYANSRVNPGFIFNNSPSENPGGFLGSPRVNFYWTVSNTDDGSETLPFSRKSVEHRSGGDLYVIGANTFYDITNNANNVNDQIILENNSINFTLQLNGTAHLYGGLVINSGETFQVNENATIRINAFGYVENNSSTLSYNSTNSTLVYQNGGAYTVASEWPASGGPTNITTGSSGTSLSINADRSLNGDLSLVSGSTMSLSGGVEVNVIGDFVNEGTVNCNTTASASGYSQIRISETVSGSGVFNFNVHVPNAGWHNIGLPVGAVNLSELGTVGTDVHPNTQNVFFWNAASSTWSNVASGSVANVPGRGYSVFVGTNGVQSAAGTMNVSGTINTSVAPSLSYHGDGWNLVANPFPCALDFHALTKTNVNNAYAIWNPGSSSYTTVSPVSPASAEIAPMQAFWVQANAGSPSLGTMNMADHGTVSSSPAFLKTQQVIADRFYLEVFENANSQLKDAFLLGMVAGTTDGLDSDWDGGKLRNGSGVPNLSCVVNGKEMAINAIDFSPNNVQGKKLPMRFVSNKNHEVYTIELNDDLLTNTYHLALVDHYLNKTHDFAQGGYVFEHVIGQEDRFELLINNITTVNNGLLPIGAQAISYGSNGNGFSLKSNLETGGRLTFYDLSGKRIMVYEIPAGTSQQYFDMNHYQRGVYLVEIETAEGKQFDKVYID